MKLLVVSCSLSPQSKSARLAARLADAWRAFGDDAELLDLRRAPLPFCDGDAAYADDNARLVGEMIAEADAVALAVPIYNYDVGGAARNLIAMTGGAWKEKVVGLIGAAGGQRSYMALMPLASSLMLDFRCAIVPRFVYASAASFADGELADPDVEERLVGLARDLRRFAGALAAPELAAGSPGPRLSRSRA